MDFDEGDAMISWKLRFNAVSFANTESEYGVTNEHMKGALLSNRAYDKPIRSYLQ